MQGYRYPTIFPFIGCYNGRARPAQDYRDEATLSRWYGKRESP